MPSKKCGDAQFHYAIVPIVFFYFVKSVSLKLNISQNCTILFFIRRYLKRLNLAGNEFTVVPRPLEEAEALEYLSLDDNPIRVIDSANAFPNLTKLRELSLRNMASLTMIRNDGLSKLIGLEDLRVKNCKKLKVIEEYAIAITVYRK